MLGGILILAVIATAWIGIRGFLAYQHLTDARATASDAASALADPASAAELIREVSADTAAARDLTNDLVWKAGEQLPWVGPQLAAVSSVAATLNDVASDALTPLASAAASFSLDSIRPRNGSIDLSTFRELEGAASESASGMAAAASVVGSIDPAPLVGPLRDAVDEITSLLRRAHVAADALNRTAALFPPMLGADGPRDYLIVFQNNAEWRSLGGIVGAMALVHTENGQLTLSAQAASSDFPRYDDPVVPMTDDEIRLFGRQPASYVQNVTQIPDFTRDAPIVQAMWQRQTGTTIDGVISLDPVALSYLLEATGPISLPTGDELNAENAVQLLLNEVYLRYEDPRQQDAFFAAAASSVFSSLTTGSVDPAALVTALGRAGEEHRLMIWNAAPEEQSVLDGTTLQGILGPIAPDEAEFGVYLNAGTASKMDYYMQVGAGVESCTSGEGTLRVTLRSSAPADAASLPTYITGSASFGVPPGEVETIAYIYLPEHSALVSTTLPGQEDAPRLGGGIDAGRQVLVWRTQLAPGAESTLDVTVTTPDTDKLTARITPTAHGVETATACEKR
ncbi:peptide synthetase [Actinomycetales bacterium SN12]|nr:peptide synthetase [Actinomycetales bacterium SN12]